MAILSKDVTVQFRGYTVKAKAGTKLWNVGWPDSPLYAIPPEACDAGDAGDHDRWSIFNHDSTYYYIWAPEDAISYE